jgi:hypothetical protein
VKFPLSAEAVAALGQLRDKSCNFVKLKLDQVRTTSSSFNCLDLYHKPQDSGERQYRSRTLKREF